MALSPTSSRSGGSSVTTVSQLTSWDDVTSALQTAYTPGQLTMRQVQNVRSIDWPIWDGSCGLIVRDPFTNDDLTRWGQYTRSGSAGTPTVTQNADGSVTVSASAGGVATKDFVSGFRPRILAFAAEVTIKAGFVAADLAAVEVGLRTQDGTKGLWAYYNGTGLGIALDGAGPTAPNASPAQPTAYTVDTTKDLTIGLYMTDPTALAYVRQGEQTAYVTKSDFTLDGTASHNRLASTLQTWRLGFSLGLNASKSATVTRFQAAYMPSDSFTNPRWVRYKDGQPYQRNGLYYFTGTVHVASSFADHSTVLFSFDPSSCRARAVSHLFASISGSLQHIGPGQLLFDPSTDVWTWFTSTWGTTGTKAAGVDMAIGTTDRDVIGGGVFVVPITVVSLGANSYYDGDARYDTANSKWRVGMIETSSRTAWANNYPTYYEGADLTSLTKIRQDSGNGNQDGAQWTKVGGTWYLVFGGASHFNAYDENLQNFVALTSWDSNVPAAIFNSFGVYPPHAALQAINEDAVTRYVVLSYGADVQGPTSLRGALVVLEADEQPSGWEFPLRQSPVRMRC